MPVRRDRRVLTPTQLAAQVATLERTLHRVRDDLRTALTRAEVAEQSCREAWRFSKALVGTGNRIRSSETNS
jgi:hypothetical protein